MKFVRKMQKSILSYVLLTALEVFFPRTRVIQAVFSKAITYSKSSALFLCLVN